LTVDGHQFYKRVIDRFSFDATRAINTIIDYRDMINDGSWNMITKVPPTKPLGSMISTDDNNGILHINEERDYKCRFILSDEFGNSTNIDFIIKGRKCDLPIEKGRGTLFCYNGDNSYSLDGLSVFFPKGIFYEDVYFCASKTSNPTYKSDVHNVGDESVPLAKSFDIAIDLTCDDVADKSKYCLVKLNNKRRSAVSAKYENGKMVAKLNTFGNYAVTTDTKAPQITPVKPVQWRKTGKLTFKISDNLSGISRYRGEIDGKFALFEYDGKSGNLSFKMDATRFKKNVSHSVKIVVEDACGNVSTVTDTFKW